MKKSSKTPAPFYQAHNYRPEESVGYLMRSILSHLSLAIEHELAPTELTHAQWLPLFKLFIGKASTAAELARECRLDAGATTRMLDRMEAKGLCARTRSQEDRRVVHLALTPAGERAAQGIPAVLSKVQNAHLAGFSTEEFELLKVFLRRILDNAQALNAPAAPPTSPPTTP
ncbi:MAG: MarR family transcriptional regulator [Burkholderiales bacterium PBB4]|nr:MAG: MarR family transcriptional regulator [Burkholderiales bacterium PBB4]